MVWQLLQIHAAVQQGSDHLAAVKTGLLQAWLSILMPLQRILEQFGCQRCVTGHKTLAALRMSSNRSADGAAVGAAGTARTTDHEQLVGHPVVPGPHSSSKRQQLKVVSGSSAASCRQWHQPSLLPVRRNGVQDSASTNVVEDHHWQPSPHQQS